MLLFKLSKVSERDIAISRFKEFRKYHFAYIQDVKEQMEKFSSYIMSTQSDEEKLRGRLQIFYDSITPGCPVCYKVLTEKTFNVTACAHHICMKCSKRLIDQNVVDCPRCGKKNLVHQSDM
jgi:hypothetical protein